MKREKRKNKKEEKIRKKKTRKIIDLTLKIS